MGSRITVQIALIVVSVVIIATYINPQFQKLKETQDETTQYQEAVENGESFLAELDRLELQAATISNSQLDALNEYLPTEVDPVVVMRDLSLIVERSGLELTDVNSAEAGDVAGGVIATPAQGQFFEDDDLPMPQRESRFFTLGTAGTYEQLKDFLRLLEQNKYPLKVSNLTFAADDSVFLTFQMVIETYALISESN